jgi:hypothetical protein
VLNTVGSTTDLSLTIDSTAGAGGQGGSRGFLFSSTAVDGDGGLGGGASAMVDAEGQGDILITADVQGGNGGDDGGLFGGSVGTSAGDGGSATIDGVRAVSNSATGEVEVRLTAAGGNGGDGVNTGNGGAAIIDNVTTAVSNSPTGEVTVRLTATGGNGGDATSFSSNGGNGANAIINNVIDATASSDILIVQIANGGRAGAGAVDGVAGNAFSGATTTESTDNLTVIADANGGFAPDRDNGVGGTGEGDVNITNLVGNASATVDVQGGLGGQGGTGIGRAVATGGGSGTTASARAEVDGGGGGNGGVGGDAMGFAEGVNSGSGQANSVVFANADSLLFGQGGAADGQARATVVGTGRATATVNVQGGSGSDNNGIGGSATGDAYAESTLGDANASVALMQGGGSDVRNFDLSAVNAGDGRSFNGGVTAAGSAGGLLSLNFNTSSGRGGDVDTLGNGNGGNGGSATSQFQSSDLNSGGDNVRLTGRISSGGGGTGRGTGDGGASGDASVGYDIADTGDVSSDLTVIAGSGGTAFGLGDGGNSGNANFNLRATSTTNGLVNISSNVQSGVAGSAETGAAGDAGDATSDLFGTSHGGDVSVDSFAWASDGGRNFGTGLAGDGGDARANAVALTSQGAATAEASTIGGTGGSGNVQGIGGDGLSSAFADNRFIGLGNGGSARAEADARGVTGRAEATAVTGNSEFGLVQINSVAEGVVVDALSLTRVGGGVFNGDDGFIADDLPRFNAGGQIVVAPDNIPISSCSSCGVSNDLLTLLGLNDNTDTDSVLAVGSFAGTSIDGAATLATSEARFRIGIDPSAADDLLLGFFGGSANGVALGQIDLTVDIEGFDTFEVSFTDEINANNFFTDTVINLGDFANINLLAGVGVLEGTVTFDYFAGANEGSYFFNYAIAGTQTAELAAIPEPSTLPLICTAVAMLVGRRRRTR